jgi:hypothetical protein
MYRVLLVFSLVVATLCCRAFCGEVQSRVWSTTEGVITETVRYNWRFSQSDKHAEIAVYKQSGLPGWTLKFEGKSSDAVAVTVSSAEASEALTDVMTEFAKERPKDEIGVVALNLEAMPELMADVSAVLKAALLVMPGKVQPKSPLLRQAMLKASRQVWQKSSLPKAVKSMGYEIVGTDTWDHVPIDLSMVGKPWPEMATLERLGLSSPQIMVIKLKRKSVGK